MLAILPFLGAVGALLVARSRGIRRDETWTCGSSVTPRSQYTATAFSKPVRRIFSYVLFPDHQEIRDVGISRWYPVRIRYTFTTREVIDERARDIAAFIQRLRAAAASSKPASCASTLPGCEHELNALSGPDYDITQSGFDLVASARHADAATVTGPMTGAMCGAAKLTVDAVPNPKIVIAIGDCALARGGKAGRNERRARMPAGTGGNCRRRTQAARALRAR